MRPRHSILTIGVLLAIAVWTGASALGREGRARNVREEYKTTAQQAIVLRGDLAAIPGKQATILRVELPGGWIGERHYHTGDVFVYVLEGEFAVEVDGESRKTFGPGDVYHEAVGKVMQAHNTRTTQTTRLILFQIGNKDEPLMIKAL